MFCCFFKQKTAYEMRISDWSSDVCSSDLRGESAHLGDTPSGPTPEHAKIKGAIRTDFILSAEIIAMTLGTVASAAFPLQASVVAGVALIMTVGVYGLVAGIVKLDDAGLYLSQRKGDTEIGSAQV